MKQVDEMPKTGHFVKVWEGNGVIWSGNFKLKPNGLVMRYDNGNWFNDNPDPGDVATDVRYFVA